MFTHTFTGIPVADRDGAVDWYTRLVGRPPRPDPQRRRGGVAGNGQRMDLRRSGRRALRFGASRADGRRTDAFVAEIGERGLSVSLEKTGDGLRFALITDPYGNQLKVARPPD